MKKLILLSLIFTISNFSLLAQQMHISKAKQNQSVELTKDATLNGGMNLSNDFTRPSYKFLVDEVELGTSVYDLQTNASIENRFFRHSDGTMGAVWTMGFEDPGFDGRGTGYVYYDGNEWSEEPSDRIEETRTGWPNYASLGDNGEIVASHTGTEIIFSKRENKGTGDWEYFSLAGPEGQDIIWPRMVTHENTIHVVAATPNTANNGTIYEGLDGAVLYSRSTDGGETWVDENIILPGMSSDEYTGLNADTYIWAQNGETIALVLSSLWYGHDLFMVKSEDNGETWEKTIIWENPYTQVDYADIVTAPDTLAAAGGNVTADIDSEGNVHVAFDLNRAYKEETGEDATFSSFPFYEGIVYWNETMEPFEADNQHNALAFENLVENETYVGWVPDVDGDGELDIEIEELYNYNGYSTSTYPTMSIDGDDNVYLAYSTPREDLQSSGLKLRHIFGRAKVNGYWFGDPNDVDELDLTNSPLHAFDECIFPQMANILPDDEKFYIMYQRDLTPGFAVGTEPDHEFTTNNVTLIEATNEDFGVYTDIENTASINESHKVSQNFPNPFSSTSEVTVEVAEDAQLSLEVVNLVGQTVQRVDKGFVNAGTHSLEISGTNLETGVYFYNVHINDETITKKMVIR